MGPKGEPGEAIITFTNEPMNHHAILFVSIYLFLFLFLSYSYLSSDKRNWASIIKNIGTYYGAAE